MVPPSNIQEQVFCNCINGALRVGYGSSVRGGRKEKIETLSWTSWTDIIRRVLLRRAPIISVLDLRFHRDDYEEYCVLGCKAM
jgi:hypothetical protein